MLKKLRYFMPILFIFVMSFGMNVFASEANKEGIPNSYLNGDYKWVMFEDGSSDKYFVCWQNDSELALYDNKLWFTSIFTSSNNAYASRGFIFKQNASGTWDNWNSISNQYKDLCIYANYKSYDIFDNYYGIDRYFIYENAQGNNLAFKLYQPVKVFSSTAGTQYTSSTLTLNCKNIIESNYDVPLIGTTNTFNGVLYLEDGEVNFHQAVVDFQGITALPQIIVAQIQPIVPTLLFCLGLMICLTVFLKVLRKLLPL